MSIILSQATAVSVGESATGCYQSPSVDDAVLHTAAEAAAKARREVEAAAVAKARREVEAAAVAKAQVVVEAEAAAKVLSEAGMGGTVAGGGISEQREQSIAQHREAAEAQLDVPGRCLTKPHRCMLQCCSLCCACVVGTLYTCYTVHSLYARCTLHVCCAYVQHAKCCSVCCDCCGIYFAVSSAAISRLI